MKIIYFIVTTLIILIPLLYVLKYKGDTFLGLNLSKKWFWGLLIAELLWLIVCWVNYQSNISSSTANDFLWHNQFNYYRGVLPITILTNIKDFSINTSSGWILLPVYIMAIVVDYSILGLISFLRK